MRTLERPGGYIGVPQLPLARPGGAGCVLEPLGILKKRLRKPPEGCWKTPGASQASGSLLERPRALQKAWDRRMLSLGGLWTEENDGF